MALTVVELLAIGTAHCQTGNRHEVRSLIRQMSLANPRWGAPRIHGELLKIGIEVSQATVAKYMVRQRSHPPRRGEPFSRIMPRTWFLPISSSSQRLPFSSYSSS